MARDLSFYIREKKSLEDFNKCATAYVDDLAEEIYKRK